jgi:hypothetical protein
VGQFVGDMERAQSTAHISVLFLCWTSGRVSGTVALPEEPQVISNDSEDE